MMEINMPKMTSTLTEMEEQIYREFVICRMSKTLSEASIPKVVEIIMFLYHEFTLDVIETSVKRIYLKDFKTD